MISNSEEGGEAYYIGPGPSISRRQNSCTPSLSLLYDFNNTEEDMVTAELPKSFDGSEADLSQFSDLSYNTIGSTADLDVHIRFNDSPSLLPGKIDQQSSLWITQEQAAAKHHRSVSMVAAHLKTTNQQNK